MVSPILGWARWVLALFGLNGFVQAYNGQRGKAWLFFIVQFVCSYLARKDAYPFEYDLHSPWAAAVIVWYFVNLIDGLTTAYRISGGKAVSH